MYASKRIPRVKQQEALQKMEGLPAFALLMAMRTGKTKVTCDDFGRLHDADKVDDFLIIAPAGVYHTWGGHDENNTIIGAIADDWPNELLNKSSLLVWESGTFKSEKRKRELTRFMAHKKGPRILIMNVEALSTVEDAQDLVLEFCGTTYLDQATGKPTTRRVYCAVDESTTIKNPKSKRAKFIVNKVGPLCQIRRILSGLITPRSPLDLYAQFAFLDKRILGHDHYKTFEARYAILQKMETGGRRFSVVVGHRHVDELSQLIQPHSFRVRLEDCYDMPPSDYSFRDVALTDDQRRIYRELKEYATAQLAEEAHVTANSVITQILRLHQVLCGHTVDEFGVEHLIPETRTASLIQLLEDYEGKAIIWCSYDVDIQKVAGAITKTFGEGSCARFWGGNKSTREQEEVVFKNDPSCRFMVATPDAGGWGRTWHVANLVIYYSSKNNLEHRAQSEERPKADGKLLPIAYVDFRAPGTVEEKIIQALRGKIDMSTAINGDNYREWLI